MAEAGFEFVVIDLEHSPLTLESAYRLIFGAQTLGMTALMRVADRSGNYLQRILDSGADGVLVPQVSSLAEATLAIEQMTFSPRGRRGMGGTSRAGGWGLASTADYVAEGDAMANHPELVELTDNLLRQCSARGLPCGTAVGDAAAAGAAAERGFSFIMVSNDTTIFARAAAEIGRSSRAELDRARPGS